MNLREQLLANKPAVKPIDINGTTYFIREFTVGEMNHELYGQQQRLIRIAEEKGIVLTLNDENELAKQLAQVYDEHKLARTLAARLCDEQGNLLFNPDNPDDLHALSGLNKNVFEQLLAAMAEENPKNSPTDASSKSP